LGTQELDILKIIWESGIVVKFVLLLLIVASLLSWAIVFKKRSAIKELKENNQDFLDVYRSSQSLKDVMIKAEMLPFSPYKSMFINGYRELTLTKETLGDDQKLLGEHYEKFGFESVERALKKGVNESNLKMESSLSTLASIGSVSPFIGLFGTVWGIIDSFKGLAGGGATLDAVAPGIAEALVATAVGLAAAIPAVWFYNKFVNDNQTIATEMESFGQEFLNVVERSVSK
jgi:biopolymer transport protein TolQ